ncbi:MAG: T9SS type A sorting domain-containing protein [Candidatus Latescibacteria bacterium]|nr:T9SS type A sorting domain-containing protein [Candidatus Latescibacterota bacterium]
MSVSINIDLTGEEDLLGEYTLEITWNSSVIEYKTVSGGTSPGFSSLMSNESETGSGKLSLTYINSEGAEDLINVAQIMFAALHNYGAETDIGLTAVSLSAAKTFENLLPGHTVEPGHITINSPPVIMTTELPNAFINIPYNTRISVNDNDESDSHVFELLESPEWMTINPNSGVLTGEPAGDSGSGITVSVRVEDSAGLADTLTTAISLTTDFIILKEPEAGTVWSVGGEYEITWVYSGIINVKIELSVDGGSNWDTIVNSTPASSGSYTWDVLDHVSENCVIRLSDVSDSALYQVSGVFTIRQPEITIERIDPVLKAVQNDRIDFQVRVKSNMDIAEVVIYWDTTGDRMYDNRLDMTSSDGEIYSAALMEGTFTSEGIEYYIVAKDNENNIARLPDGSKHFCICAMVSGVVSKAPVAGGTVQTAYRMASIPLEFTTTSIVEQLTDTLPVGKQGPDWRIFSYPPGNNTPQEYPDIVTGFKPATALWIISKNDYTMEAPPGTTVTTEEPFKIELKPGWNDIANPWMFDISWSDISNPSNADLDGLFAYENKWLAPDEQQVMKPWKGYSVRNMSNRPVIIFLKPEPAVAVGKKVVEFNRYDWKLSISAQAGDAIDTENYFGVIPDAEVNWDKYDHVEPPPVGEFVSVSFPHTDWGKYPYNYSVDCRPSDNEISWNFNVSTNISYEKISVGIIGIEQLPESYNVIVYDLDSDEIIDISSRNFCFISGKNQTEKHFRLVVKNKNENTFEQNSQLPKSEIITSCYPNPFNPQTTIRYELSRPGQVKLIVFNSVGQQIMSRDMGFKNEGAYEFVFDGSRLTSGMYVYRIDAGNSHISRKMSLVR